MIMEFCVGVEYLNFRATCKQCQLAAPMIRWSSETAIRRLQTYSLISPWLIVLDKYQGIITFTDPMFGDKYFMKTPQELVGDLRIYCSRYGWLLFYKFSIPRELLFFNPFRNDIREVPNMTFYFDSVCFSTPPTSPDCIVVGLSASLPAQIFIYFINREPSWRMFHMDFGVAPPHSFLFSTFYGQDIYALNEGALDAFRKIEGRPVWDGVVSEAPRGRSTQYFLVNCDEHHLVLVMVDELGKFVEASKLNDSTQEWEKIDSLG
ncbi:hypothetical protein HanRHA438_Chr14g0659841 [Helianthus annuus]|nr:hypothetical protein HanHA300_Chr14g0528351 [Helianthus annuus]KAJ0469103.1 hypothetical protein HanIR_Chr14g0704251 [Helianthus annuus]KAJ0656659.1 hypothetical protein HanLR1_Chr14g0538451 [Helianthus annuus]KAJ0660260.1 hypothetical protein HanOQP8_Chr14g0535831 [Helianthus annuus]KAJ0854185.1 hypothetical protein HanRHA438_Chr14g0659841 [Helianthus annuus]